MNMMKYIVVVIAALLFTACGKEEEKIIVPGYPNFKVDINNQDTELRTPGNMKVFTKPRLAGESVGYSGLLVVSNIIQDNGVISLSAYDLCCPNEKLREVAVVPSAEDGIATCSKCGKMYDLFSGGYEKSSTSSSRLRLQFYTVRSESNNTIFYIYR
jgi:hypothetical protein